jgi:hypothetical protein
VSSGRYGDVFIVRGPGDWANDVVDLFARCPPSPDPELDPVADLGGLLSLRRGVVGSVRPPPGTALAFKLQRVRCGKWERDAIGEDNIHLRVSKGTAVFPSGEVVRGVDVAPLFFCGASVKDPAWLPLIDRDDGYDEVSDGGDDGGDDDTATTDEAGAGSDESDDDEGWYRVTVMEGFEPGARTLDDLQESESSRVRKCRLDACVYSAIERALSAMWLLGVVHADLHGDNILVLPGGGVRIIDYGMGVMLSRPLGKQLRAALLSRPPCLPPDIVFDAVCLPRMHRIMRRRGISAREGFYDGACLRSIRRQWWTRRKHNMILLQRSALWATPM